MGSLKGDHVKLLITLTSDNIKRFSLLMFLELKVRFYSSKLWRLSCKINLVLNSMMVHFFTIDHYNHPGFPSFLRGIMLPSWYTED